MVTTRRLVFAEKSKILGRPSSCALLLAALATTACMTPPFSEAPIATNYSAQAQKKPQSASHWSLIANDLVEQIKPTITGNGVFVTSVRKAPAETAFSRIFRSQVVSALSGKGIKVNKEASSSAMTLEIDAQLVRFSPGRRQTKEAPILTLITSGLWVLDGLDHARTRNLIFTETAAATSDWREWYYSQYATGPTPIGELVVTLSVSNTSQILGQRTEVYYIADVDEQLYNVTPPVPPAPPPKMPIKGGA